MNPIRSHTLRPRFERVTLLPYWSTQSAWGQQFGDRFLSANTFGLVAEGRVPSGDDSGTDDSPADDSSADEPARTG